MCYSGSYMPIGEDFYGGMGDSLYKGPSKLSDSSIIPKIDLKPECCRPDEKGNVQCGTSGCGGHCK